MTEWWAFKPVTTAFEKTKKILLEPFNAWTWLKLMIIVFFVGTGTSRLGNQFGNSFNYNTGPSDTAYMDQTINSILSNSTLIAIIIAVVVLAILLALLFAYLRNVFSFVLIKSLTSGDVQIIKPFMENLGKGFRLFIFTLLAGIVTLAVVLVFIGIAILAILMAVKLGTSTAAGIVVLVLAIFLILLLILLMIIFSVIMGIFVGFTYDFVAPMVYFKNMGIVESWKWLWASIKKDWQQYGVYVITRWAVELAIGILSLFIILPVALIFIAILVFGGMMAAALINTSLVLAVIIGLVLLAILAVFVIVMMAITMPIAVYLRYFSLDVLKQIDPSAVVYSDRFAMPPAPPQPTLPA